MYVNLDELGLPQARSVKRLQKILTDPQYDISAFRERFCPYDSPDTAKKVCETWIGGKNTLPVETVKNNGKEKVLVFTQRAVDTALVEEMNEQVAKDSEIREYYLTFPASVMKKTAACCRSWTRESIISPSICVQATRWQNSSPVTLCSAMTSKTVECW